VRQGVAAGAPGAVLVEGQQHGRDFLAERLGAAVQAAQGDGAWIAAGQGGKRVQHAFAET
jgi:hypothetical protein